MTIAHALVALAVVGTGALAAMGLHLLLLSVAAARADRQPPQPAIDDGPVTVLVPCHQEGESAARAVRSLLNQDYGGPLTVLALLSPGDEVTREALTSMADSDDRLQLLTGRERSKAAKLNEALEAVQTPWVAFLDADHLADADWISLSIGLLRRAPLTTAGVQARRRPFAVRSLSQLWDAAQAHAGNERLNAGRQALGLPVCFTGTTAVFRRDALGTQPFGASLTEDTELSYRLLATGLDIAWLSAAGSAEEVAPDLASFVRRRRRWAAGHTAVAWRTFTRGPRPAGIVRAAALLAHGAFYLAPPLAFAVLAAMGLYTGAQLDTAAVGLALIAAAGIGLALASRWTTGLAWLVDGMVAAAWCLPQAVLAVPLVFRLTDAERYWLLIAFPGADALLVVDGLLIALPLVLLLVAVWTERPFSAAHAARLIVSYPFFLVVEMVAVSLGVLDLALGRSRWPAIPRTLEDADTDHRRALPWIVSGGALVLGALVSVLVHDLTLTSGCASDTDGRAPLLLDDARPGFELNVRRAPVGADVELTGVLTWQNPDGDRWTVRHIVAGLDANAMDVDRQHPRAVARTRRPMGFEALRWVASAERGGEVCTFSKTVTTTVRRVQGTGLSLNGEPFLMKGVVPSFALGRAVDDVQAGLEQLRALGANTVRYYHPTSPAAGEAVKALGLLTLDQPRRSTWDEIDLDDPRDVERWAGRFAAQLDRASREPHALLVVAGNELELHAPQRHAATLKTLTRRMRRRHGGRLWGYATFFLFVDYDAPVLGVNMLDTGPSYWEGGLTALRDRGRPFFASELGAFVAMHEAPSLAMRAARLKRQWRALLRAGAWGGVVFQSHDNWAQPLPTGINDPFTAEQPDDRRGLFSRDGAPTPLVDVVARLFNDLRWSWSPGRELVLENRRPYTLHDLVLMRGEEALMAPITLAPGDVISITLASSDEPAAIEARYTTHGGLEGRSRLPAVAGPRPVLLTGDALPLSTSDDRIELLIVGPRPLSVGLPERWRRARIGDRVLPVDGHIEHRPGPIDEVLVSAIRADGDEAFSPLAGTERVTGDVVLRFELPDARDGSIVLAGLGAKEVTVSCLPEGRLRTHAYREVVLERAALQGERCDVAIASRSAVFLPAPTTARGETLGLPIEVPRWFHPERLVIERVE